jgi:hypothetical protein
MIDGRSSVSRLYNRYGRIFGMRPIQSQACAADNVNFKFHTRLKGAYFSYITDIQYIPWSHTQHTLLLWYLSRLSVYVKVTQVYTSV